MKPDNDAINVLGEPLKPCGLQPVTGFYRDGWCNTGPGDVGLHGVCVQVDEAFLAFSHYTGNDLSTPAPEYGFPGLKPGDRWCICASRWLQALDAGYAPRVFLAATHEAVLDVLALDDLKVHALDLN